MTDNRGFRRFTSEAFLGKVLEFVMIGAIILLAVALVWGVATS